MLPFPYDTDLAGAFVSGPVRLVTDCSGLETPSLALRLLGVENTLVSASEVHPKLRDFIQCHVHPLALLLALAAYDRKVVGLTDLYVAGPACQGCEADFLSRRLQGIGDGQLSRCLSQNQFRAACGNAMSVHVLSRLLARLLPHCRLTGELTDLGTRWVELRRPVSLSTRILDCPWLASGTGT